MLAFFRNPAAVTRKGDEGASAVEYGLLLAAIAAIIILLVYALGGFIKGAFQDTCDAFDNSSVTSATNQSCT